MSQLSCFLEMLVQLRSRATGCLRMIPLSIRGVMDLQRFRLMCFQSLLSQHLMRETADVFAGLLCDEVQKARFSSSPSFYSPSVPGPADTHADAEISVTEVTEHHHPGLSLHHMRFAVVQGQSVGRGADGRGPDHVALHLDTLRWRPAGKRSRAYWCDRCVSVPTERRVATRHPVHLPPPVSQPVAQVAAAIIKRPPGLLFVHFTLGLRFHWPLILIGQAVFCFQRQSVLIVYAFFHFKGFTTRIGRWVLSF